jgi:hypothetical protein
MPGRLSLIFSHSCASALYPLARLVAGEGKRRGCCGFFRSSRDARVRVQGTVAFRYCQALLIICTDFYFRFRAMLGRNNQL